MYCALSFDPWLGLSTNQYIVKGQVGIKPVGVVDRNQWRRHEEAKAWSLGALPSFVKWHHYVSSGGLSRPQDRAALGCDAGNPPSGLDQQQRMRPQWLIGRAWHVRGEALAGQASLRTPYRSVPFFFKLLVEQQRGSTESKSRVGIMWAVPPGPLSVSPP